MALIDEETGTKTTSIRQRTISVLGPIKLEILLFQDLDTGDTVTSALASPRFAFCAYSGAEATNAATFNLAISGKTITNTNSGATNQTPVMFVFGF